MEYGDYIHEQELNSLAQRNDVVQYREDLGHELRVAG